MSKKRKQYSIDFTFVMIAAIAYHLLGSFPSRNLNMMQYFR
ncbi:hypothetical protein [Nitrosomonas sp.]